MNIFEILIVTTLILFAIGIARINFKKNKTLNQKDLKEIKKHWINIKELIKTNRTKAILDADKLLNLAFKKRGITGSTGHQLKTGAKYITNIQSTWDAHKLRNKIAHELTNINEKDSTIALKNFKKAINDLTKANIK